MVNFFSLRLILVSNELSGKRARKKSSGDRESPWKMPYLILMGLDVIVPLACLRCRVVFQVLIFYLMKFTITGQIL